VSKAPIGVRNRLQAAREASREGRYREALEHHIWFHDHALEQEPAMYGVRLSFALADWLDLGSVYAPALRAMKRKRTEKTRALLRGEGDWHLFHDVVAINERLEDDKRTRLLYVRLAAKQPELAHECERLALPSIVRSGDFKLAEKLLPDPTARIKGLCRELNKDVERAAARPERRRQLAMRRAFVQNYADDVAMLINVLNERHRADEADELMRLALKLIASTSVRRSFRACLVEKVSCSR
jgi:hypothetical protein